MVVVAEGSTQLNLYPYLMMRRNNIVHDDDVQERVMVEFHKNHSLNVMNVHFLQCMMINLMMHWKQPMKMMYFEFVVEALV